MDDATELRPELIRDPVVAGEQLRELEVIEKSERGGVEGLPPGPSSVRGRRAGFSSGGSRFAGGGVHEDRLGERVSRGARGRAVEDSLGGGGGCAESVGGVLGDDRPPVLGGVRTARSGRTDLASVHSDGAPSDAPEDVAVEEEPGRVCDGPGERAVARELAGGPVIERRSA
ncbi:hypothetical protein OIE13_13390 [Streptosporangium sp. NBC_01810]|uniref:hypothetical protein n=1 Tax=Streptosporangium sp. NBC_01810 TaxID=2975951 RepID=UPI002DD8EA7F|nr:hypothetical protein [Streptosporangium sp. NBC_01810]WSA28777.1 hypothetical protein OIE13_13390 [Streptosporangium sp. NBC_01810]